uniref:Uncharacterized protein n=1 Tax=Pseudonaja textilis TaxID=8673 RepID=A0A670YEN2_PSETE
MGILSWLVVLSILFLCFWKSQRPKGFPPGPWSPPLTGILFYLSRKEPLKLAQKYGPVFSLYLGGKRAVFTHGFSSAKEVLVTKGLEFAGRPDNLLVDYMIKKKGTQYIISPYGQAWKEQRRFSLMLLRNFGLGKKSMEEKILQEATCLIEAFAENSGAPFDPQPFVETAVTNIISSILFGKRFENNDSSLRTVLNILHQNLKLIVGPWGTIILINLHSVHHDESQWKFPHEFNPSNFLNEEGDFVKPEAFLAFSAGPRVCLGENLARMELFLFLTSILRNFQLSWPDKSRAPDLTPNLGLTQFPSSFKILMKSRQESN